MTRGHRHAHLWLWLAVGLSVGVVFSLWLMERVRGGP